MLRIPLEIIAVGSILFEVPPLFLIFAIVKKSPEKMKFIRLFLLKMVIFETIFTHCLLWGYWRDVFKSYFPLPLLKVGSFFEYFGDLGGLLALLGVLVSGGLSLIGVVEGCIVRCGITYNIPFILKFSNGIPFALFQLVEVIAALGLLTVLTSLVNGMPAAEQFAKEHGAYRLLEEFDVEHDVVTFIDPYATKFGHVVFPLFGGLILLTPLMVCGLTYLTHRKIMETAQLMSTENFVLQKRLTIMILAQAVLPMVLIVIPLCAMGIALFSSSIVTDRSHQMLYDHTNLGFPIVCTPLTLYPLANTVAIIVIMKPYRTAIYELIPITRRSRTRPLS